MQIGQPTSGLEPLSTQSGSSKAAPMDKAHAALKKATEQFESYFLHQMLQEMRKTVPKDTLLGDDSNQEQIFQDMMDQTVADSMSKREDLGISKMLYAVLAPSLPGNAGPGVMHILPNGTSAFEKGRSLGAAKTAGDSAAEPAPTGKQKNDGGHT